MAKMWAGRTDGMTEKIADDFNSSIRFDSRMYRQDITGSMTHAAMLSYKGIISQTDADTHGGDTEGSSRGPGTAGGQRSNGAGHSHGGQEDLGGDQVQAPVNQVGDGAAGHQSGDQNADQHQDQHSQRSILAALNDAFFNALPADAVDEQHNDTECDSQQEGDVGICRSVNDDLSDQRDDQKQEDQQRCQQGRSFNFFSFEHNTFPLSLM